MTGQQDRRYPESLTMRRVSVDARGRSNRAERFRVVTTILAECGGVPACGKSAGAVGAAGAEAEAEAQEPPAEASPRLQTGAQSVKSYEHAVGL
jgi:hypothetical protein